MARRAAFTETATAMGWLYRDRADLGERGHSFVLRQSRTDEAFVLLPQIDETDAPLTCCDSRRATLTCLMISGLIDTPGCLTYLRHHR